MVWWVSPLSCRCTLLFSLWLTVLTMLTAIPYAKNPSSDPEFRVYFSKEWYEALQLSVRNFFNEIFNSSHILQCGLHALMSILLFSFMRNLSC